MRSIFSLIFALLAAAEAVELRVATFNIGANFGETFFDYGIGEPGGVDYETVKAVLARIDAEVVTLQEIHTADLADNPSDLDTLASELGYPYVFVPPTTGGFDNTLRIVMLSKYPFLSTDAVMSPPGAKELVRAFPVIEVDVPGTDNDPLIIATHLKAGTGSADRFRRAIEMRRVAEYLAATGVTAQDNYFVIGDFNPSGTNVTFSSLPSGLPGSYSLGSDVAFPVGYSRDMTSYFSVQMPVKLDPRQLNGSAVTFPTSSGGRTLDLLLVSPGLAGRTNGLEIYNSALDTSNTSGLPKAGPPLAASVSEDASDHLAVFGDFELDADLPDLTVSISSGEISEGDPPGMVSVTVGLSAVSASAVEVALHADDSAVSFVDPVLVIPAGATGLSTGLVAKRNFLIDGTRSVGVTAVAQGYDAAAAAITVFDGDLPYVFTASGQTVAENFNGFAGDHDPAPWTTTAGSWLGGDDGSSGDGGARAYGDGLEVAPGYLGGGEGLVMETSYVNDSASILTIIDVSYAAEQWRSAFGGTADTISAEVVAGGEVFPLTELGFSARKDLPEGAVAGGTGELKSTRFRELWVEPGGSFDLRFRVTPGAGGGELPDEIFINEFHYDNAGADVGEFVEIAVGPGFEGDLSEVRLVLYNGNGGGEYGTHLLSTFDKGVTTASGHVLYSKMIPGIQNGAPDGLAVVVGDVVTGFISYEGAFTAADGPAAGMTSVEIGVEQTGSEPVGMNALGLQGSGGVAGDFTWVKFVGIDHAPGQVNAGQTFVTPAASQGLAIDDVSVTFVPDANLDGWADDEDGDSDNDGMSDADELAFGTDPFDTNSVFRPVLVNGMLEFPGAAGITYVVEASGDLVSWDMEIATRTGDGSMISVPVPLDRPRLFVRVRVD